MDAITTLLSVTISTLALKIHVTKVASLIVLIVEMKTPVLKIGVILLLDAKTLLSAVMITMLVLRILVILIQVVFMNLLNVKTKVSVLKTSVILNLDASSLKLPVTTMMNVP